MKSFFPGCSLCFPSLADPRRHAPTTGYFRDSQAQPLPGSTQTSAEETWCKQKVAELYFSFPLGGNPSPLQWMRGHHMSQFRPRNMLHHHSIMKSKTGTDFNTQHSRSVHLLDSVLHKAHTVAFKVIFKSTAKPCCCKAQLSWEVAINSVKYKSPKFCQGGPIPRLFKVPFHTEA